ncbi:PREDICTED: actin cytoskeleton-regulatory complex protein pan1 isoform X2 [Rhagoletis zephyria]|uniref:actin cytoskeleton-regulatory complex protein pan1 isoform X2 n=1 Tax=Rhagoletis zephyria TaxID=28612 RepID=UPI000811376B|nr:PREDICTED: actin cytoskeleton-regulatory complex protein pan1 isoform X2 [Rhagoletis zephyria]
MEVYDDRPVSVYDNLKTPPTGIHTSTPKAVKSVNTVAAPTASPLPPLTARGAATKPTETNAANRATSSPIYAEIAFKFNDNKQLTNRESQQPLLQQQSTLPCLSQPAKQSVATSNFTDQTTPTLRFAINTTPVLNSGSNNNYHTNSNNHRSTTQAHGNTSIAMPALTPIATTATPTAPAAAAARNASAAQRPLSQHSQSELNEASQSIAAVKAALNDAKSKFFGLNGYATQDHQHTNTPQNNSNSLVHTPNIKNKTNESRLKEQTSTPHLLIDRQFPKVQIVTTAPTPPPKSQPKYQNIPANSAIFRRNEAAPPELPPKPVDAIATPSRMTATTPPTQPDGVVSTTPNSAVFSSNSAHSTTPSPPPTSPLDAGKISLSSTHAAYKHIPLNDIDTTQPSQAVYMSTTVPQNIKASQHPNPLNFKYPNLARWLLILEILVGLLISFLAIWIFCLAPNTAIQYNPYWSGLVLLLAGILGLVLVRFQRIKRHKVRENCFKFLRTDSYLLALLAVLLCCVAFFCAGLHYARLSASDTHCAPTNILLEQGSCTCTFNVNEEVTLPPPANDSASQVANGLLDEEVMPENFSDQSYKVEYR